MCVKNSLLEWSLPVRQSKSHSGMGASLESVVHLPPSLPVGISQSAHFLSLRHVAFIQDGESFYGQLKSRNTFLKEMYSGRKMFFN